MEILGGLKTYLPAPEKIETPSEKRFITYDMVTFGFDKSKKEKTWDDWSEKAELQKKKEYDKWLRKEVGEHRKFGWGNIGAYYDPKSGCSYMHLDYKSDRLWKSKETV